MKKLLFYCIVFITINVFSVYAFDEVNYYRNGIYYSVSPTDFKSIILSTPFSAMNNIERDQVHKIMLNNIEAARVSSLKFVGDKYEFNGIEIQSVLYRGDSLKYAGKLYKITDKNEQFNIIFSVGDYDTIVLHSYMTFKNRQKTPLEDIDNKYATIFTVKNMLSKITGKIDTIADLPVSFSKDIFENILPDKIKNSRDKSFFAKCYKFNGSRYVLLDTVSVEQQKNLLKIYNDAYAAKGYTDIERQNALDKFIAQLSSKKPDEILDSLDKYVTLNITASNNEYTLTDEWQTPWDLFYTGSGDYKSICLFCYYVLSRLDFNVRTYFVADLQMRTKAAPDMGKTFSETQLNLKKDYRYVSSEYSSIKELYRYNPPSIKNAVFLVAVERKNNGITQWQYSYGKKWIKCDITDGNRVCSAYTRGGCYYSDASDKEYHLLHNFPMTEDFVTWSVFF
ncbi:MAG: hypothetical protein IKQ61_12725 [Spirochaetales bacterium]|nr:hypothetical protein [Spirochaetales bacterium]